MSVVNEITDNSRDITPDFFGDDDSTTNNESKGGMTIPVGVRFKMLRTNTVVPSPLNPRKQFDATLGDLAESVRLVGIKQPILVRPKTPDAQAMPHVAYEIVMGERRFRAANLCGLEEIPCIVEEGISDADLIGLAIIENTKRSDLTALEEANAYQEALRLEPTLTQKGLGDRFGIAQSTIANALRLLALPEGVRLQIERGELSRSHGVALASLSDQPETCVRFALQGAKEGWPVATLEYKVREYKEAQERARQPKLMDDAPKAEPTPEPEPVLSAVQKHSAMLRAMPFLPLSADNPVNIGDTVRTSYSGPYGVLSISNQGDVFSFVCCEPGKPSDKRWLNNYQYIDDRLLGQKYEPNTAGYLSNGGGRDGDGYNEIFIVKRALGTGLVGPEQKPEGQLSTWFQWCSRAEVPGTAADWDKQRHEDGPAWIAYNEGLKPSEYVARQKEERGTPPLDPLPEPSTETPGDSHHACAGRKPGADPCCSCRCAVTRSGTGCRLRFCRHNPCRSRYQRACHTGRAKGSESPQQVLERHAQRRIPDRAI